MDAELPEGWLSTKLPTVAAINMGQSPPGRTYNSTGSGLPFFQGKADFGSRHPIPRKWCTQPTKVATSGDVLISVRAPVGPTNIADRECAIGRGLAAIRALGGITSELILFQLRLQETEIAARGTGSTFTAISRDDLDDIEIRVPPLAEQQRIVAQVEALLARVNTARERLARVPAILKRFRQSVLAAACSGRLTEEWRMRGSDTAIQSAAHDRFPELPSGWTTKVLTGILSKSPGALRTGPFGTLLKKHEHAKSGIPVLGIENIRSLRFVAGSKIHISREKAQQLFDYDAKQGDVLITRSGTVGQVCVVPALGGEARISTNVLRVRLDGSAVDPHFFAFCITACEPVVEQARQLTSGSTRDFLNQRILGSIIYPLPPLGEQREIVRRVDALFKLADGIEQRVKAATARAEKLTQAILAKAFRGELVPIEAELARREDRDYEPAAVLLERIRADRAGQKPSPRASPRGRGRRTGPKQTRVRGKARK
jgi:type I restriction enzyme S subunit